MDVARGALLISIACFPLLAQSQVPTRHFEVASVKVHEGPSRGRPGVFTSGTRVEANARTVVTLVMFAFDVRFDQVPLTRALEPFGDTFYDLDARTPGETPPAAQEVREMMQSLLAERFQLKFHREMREMPVYELVATKRGARLKPAAPEADTARHNKASGRNWSVTAASITMTELAELIENQGFVGRRVVDHTGLTGNYAIQLTYTPDTPPNRRTESADDISIFSALVDQLGLRLQPAKAMTDTVVVDRVEKPSGN
ncbi:MAG TPA: TIGR03435 family protein [Bryobacteraceae bacterium]|jgi:uncharacterized protein (TIGR03435 family)|nr:TIGR03435 family protein [Bryobacteraceae bacterium]